MKILNFGSLNIDHVYGVDHFVRPGETLARRLSVPEREAARVLQPPVSHEK